MLRSPVASTSDAKPLPPGFVLHSEGTTSILLSAPSQPATSANAATAVAPDVFLNPVQQYNRDLSIVAIRTWSEQRRLDKERKWLDSAQRTRDKKRAKLERKRLADGTENDGENGGVTKRRRTDDGVAEVEEGQGDGPAAEAASVDVDITNSNVKEPPLVPPTFKFTCLEALSATGLRAIRYAKEIPLLKYVVANDLSAGAVADIKRNIEHNDLSPPGLSRTSDEATAELSNKDQSTEPPQPSSSRPNLTKRQIDELTLGKVWPNQGDACAVMYSHRTESTRFDCVDLDPYGSAVPFLDAAIGSVADGGLLCVTCTDAGVLAGHNYPEKAFTHYGGVCVNAEYCHEVGLRLVLHAIATTAARYGRSIEPLLSLSIDFYMRVFVRIHTSPKEVKMLPSKTALLYYCNGCQSPHWQPMGRLSEKKVGRAGKEQVVINHTVPSGPPVGVGDNCAECGGKFHIGGPMWSAPLHDADFVQRMLDEVSSHSDDFGTSARMEGMLSLAHDVCSHLVGIALEGLFHCTSPPLNVVASSLLNAGYSVSRSHASAGSIKTSAPRAFVHDVFREWIKANPVKKDNIKSGSPATRLLAKEQVAMVDLSLHADVDTALRSKERIVRYQMNPVANWGPRRAAVKGAKSTQ